MGDLGENLIGSSDVLHIVQKHYGDDELNVQNTDIVSYEFIPFSNTTKGFLANHKFLCVIVKRTTDTGTVEEKLKFFTKILPTNSASFSSYIEDYNVFQKEVNVYRLILPDLQELHPDGEVAAKCFMATKQLIIFENLLNKQFRLGTLPGTLLDYDHLKVVLKSLANLHSASIVLEVRTGKSLPQLFPECLSENAYPEEGFNLRRTYIETTMETISSFVRLIPKFAVLPNLDQLVDRFHEILMKIFIFARTSDKYRNTFSHGDMWANNVLFRYENSKPVDSRLVDFQLARYAPPMLDVITILTIPTTSEFRKQHMKSLLDQYYVFMKEFLENHNIDIEKEIPRSEFDESVKYFKLAGLIESCLFSHITLLPSNVANRIFQNPDGFQHFFSKNRLNICGEAFKTDRIYKERLTDMVCDIMDNYVLNK